MSKKIKILIIIVKKNIYIYIYISEKLELVGGGSVINGAYPV